MDIRRVLVIEDEIPAREALVNLLQDEGFSVIGARDGQEGLESFAEFQPDIVVCDYYLPDINGLQVLRKIRQSRNGATRFILLTAGMSDAENERALRSEADSFLGKPVDLAQLQDALARTTS